MRLFGSLASVITRLPVMGRPAALSFASTAWASNGSADVVGRGGTAGICRAARDDVGLSLIVAVPTAARAEQDGGGCDSQCCAFLWSPSSH